MSSSSDCSPTLQISNGSGNVSVNDSNNSTLINALTINVYVDNKLLDVVASEEDAVQDIKKKVMELTKGSMENLSLWSLLSSKGHVLSSPASVRSVLEENPKGPLEMKKHARADNLWMNTRKDAILEKTFKHAPKKITCLDACGVMDYWFDAPYVNALAGILILPSVMQETGITAQFCAEQGWMYIDHSDILISKERDEEMVRQLQKLSGCSEPNLIQDFRAIVQFNIVRDYLGPDVKINFVTRNTKMLQQQGGAIQQLLQQFGMNTNKILMLDEIFEDFQGSKAVLRNYAPLIKDIKPSSMKTVVEKIANITMEAPWIDKKRKSAGVSNQPMKKQRKAEDIFK